jgi:hypothetical protein
MTVLRFAGIIVIIAGVGLFGVHFIGENGRSINGSIPRSSWQGAQPRKGMRIVALGAILLSVAFLISLIMPDGS